MTLLVGNKFVTWESPGSNQKISVPSWKEVAMEGEKSIF